MLSKVCSATGLAYIIFCFVGLVVTGCGGGGGSDTSSPVASSTGTGTTGTGTTGTGTTGTGTTGTGTTGTGPGVAKVIPNGVSTLAGGNACGFQNGPGSQALFGIFLDGITLDKLGNVYVGDKSSIRKIMPDGSVSTFIGIGSPEFSNSSNKSDFTDGTGASARVDLPIGLETDDQENIIFGDVNNFRLRKATPSGVVSTLAGNGKPSFPNSIPGSSTTASFTPMDVVKDANGNFFVADGNNQAILKIDPNGNVTSFAGSGRDGASVDGQGKSASFDAPRRITIDTQGNLYVSEVFTANIRKVSPLGVVTTLPQNGAIRPFRASAIAFNPIDSAVYFSENSESISRIFKLEMNGNLTVVAGGAVGVTPGSGNFDGPLSTAKFSQITYMKFDKNGVLFVADQGRCSVRTVKF